MWARRVVIMDCFAEPVSPEPQLRPLPRLLGFDLAVACRRMGVQRGGIYFVLGRGRLEIEQRLDVAAHLFSPRPPGPGFRSAVRPKDDPSQARPTSGPHFVIEWALRSPRCCRV